MFMPTLFILFGTSQTECKMPIHLMLLTGRCPLESWRCCNPCPFIRFSCHRHQLPTVRGRVLPWGGLPWTTPLATRPVPSPYC